jgi:predicted DNA repair protein MutK
MAATGLLALIDDITSILDDIALLTRVAAKKTSGVIGDDLALNADQVTGMSADRELPVVWAVAKGALLNKVILVPTALVISAFAPALVQPLLMIGGVFLCFEGFEKVWSAVFPSEDADETVAEIPTDPVAWEQSRVRGAIRTDFILSAEIVVIALGTMATEPILSQVLALSAVGVGVTALVYGLVAGLVRLDDIGLRWLKGDRTATTKRRLGLWILRGTPYLMRGLSIAGTTAMFLVGGSIVLHGIPALHHPLELLHDWAASVGAWLPGIASTVADGVAGIAIGGIIAGVVHLAAKAKRPSAAEAPGRS